MTVAVLFKNEIITFSYINPHHFLKDSKRRKSEYSHMASVPGLALLNSLYIIVTENNFYLHKIMSIKTMGVMKITELQHTVLFIMWQIL